jgi:CBS domain-containing protein
MLTVKDIMQDDVTTAGPNLSVRQLTRLLADAEISGVPVVDGSGTLLGVVSSTDVVRFTSEDGGVHVSRTDMTHSDLVRDPDEDPVEPDPFGFFLPEDSPINTRMALQQVTESKFDATAVSDIMTPVTFSVPPDMEIDELADFLVRGRIHRAVVVEEGRLVGIVTSGDVLTAVADGRLGG